MIDLSGKIPAFKKKIVSFLSKEDGKISKENIVKAGVAAATLSLVASIAAKTAGAGVETTCVPADCPTVANPSEGNAIGHDNSISLSTTDGAVRANHNHCTEHCHANHNQHGSHGSCCGHRVGKSW